MKTILRMALILLFCVTLFLCLAPSACAEYWGALQYTFNRDNGTLTIDGSGPMDDFDQNDYRAWQEFRDDIRTVQIMSDVTSIGNYAFCDCSNLENVTIGKGVMSIGEGAFFDCGKLTSISVDPENRWYCDQEGVLFSSNKKVILCFPGGKTGPYDIPSGVTLIRRGAFYESGLTSVTIPESVVSIGKFAFKDCSRLTNISVDPANTSYCDEDGVLFDKSKETIICFPCQRGGEYDIPDSVTTIGDSAFHICTRLTRVTIPDSVLIIEDDAFADCWSITDLTIGNNVTTIGERAISDMKLRSLTIPDSVTSIGDFAFEILPGTKTVKISNNLKRIGMGVFWNCGFTSVTIPDSVTSIGELAFAQCFWMESVAIPASVTSIEFAAFDRCDALTDVYYSGTEDQWGALLDHIEDFNDALFGANIHFGSILPESLTEIGEEAFAGGAFSYVVLPDSCEKIGPYAFANCQKLRKIRIPNRDAEIDPNAFENDTDLTIIGYLNSTAETYANIYGFNFQPIDIALIPVF